MSSVTLTPEIEALLRDCMDRGGFQCPEEAIQAGLASLLSQQRLEEFEQGELDSMLDNAEQRLAREGSVTLAQTRALIQELRKLPRERT